MKKDTDNKVMVIIYSDKNKFLLLKTNPKTMKLDNWYVVTGSVKVGESFEEAALREIREETNLDVLKLKPTELSFTYEWPPKSNKIKYEKALIAKVKHRDPKITRWEHLGWKWLGKKDFIKEIHWFGESKTNLRKILRELK